MPLSARLPHPLVLPPLARSVRTLHPPPPSPPSPPGPPPGAPSPPPLSRPPMPPAPRAPPPHLSQALASRLRVERESLVRRWLDRIAARVALSPTRVFPTEDLLNHVP